MTYLVVTGYLPYLAYLAKHASYALLARDLAIRCGTTHEGNNSVSTRTLEVRSCNLKGVTSATCVGELIPRSPDRAPGSQLLTFLGRSPLDEHKSQEGPPWHPGPWTLPQPGNPHHDPCHAGVQICCGETPARRAVPKTRALDPTSL